MRKKNAILKFSRAISCLLIISAFTGCINTDTDLSTPGDDVTTPNSFDFATTESVQLNVNYEIPESSEGYQVLFEVYTENPLMTDADGQIVKRSDIQPVITRMTDERGTYNSQETIPAAHGKDVYIYTSYIGVPMLYKTTFNGSSIDVDVNWNTMADAEAQTRADGEYEKVPDGLYTLGSWNVQGRPNYLDSEGTLKLSSTILTTINKTIPEGGYCPVKYRQSADFALNDPQNRKSEVKVRFIGGTSAASSAFGYYCYKEGSSDDVIRNAKKYVVFPNTKTGVGIKGGECVKLHYIDENGIDQGTEFPSGVKIGWFICNNAFRSGIVGNGYRTFYSTTSLNSDKRTHTAAFRINDFVVLSFEDWTDNDYNDVQFNVWSNPIEAIAPDVPSVEPIGPSDDRSMAYSMTYKGIVAFEDNWPEKGDYDMNDMIVKYNSVLSFNTKNEVIEATDTFTALWAGALYKNGFAYQINTERSNVKCEITEGDSSWSGQGLDPGIALATVVLFNDANEATADNTRTAVYKVKNVFENPVDHNVLGVAPYNPFIFTHKNMGKDRTEVHLVNHVPTEKANMSLFHTSADLSEVEKGVYYVSSNDYPFAINLVDAEKFTTEEGVSVDKSYPHFLTWAKSGGTTNQDWYKK